MTTNFETTPYWIKADEDKVLCDGESITGLGGKVYSASVEELGVWQEMTEEVAILSIEEATDEDYQAALTEMGVKFNDEI